MKVWYATIASGFEDTRGAIIIVGVFSIIQKVPDTGIHLKVNGEKGRVAQGSKRQVGGELTQIPVRATAHQKLLIHGICPRTIRSTRQTKKTEKNKEHRWQKQVVTRYAANNLLMTLLQMKRSSKSSFQG